MLSNYAWSLEQATISQQITLASYCGHTQYATYDFTNARAGFTDKIVGFQMTSIIYNKANDTNGFVGFLPSDKSIYVAFRGSESISNWLSDFNADKDPYRLSPECNCEVHSGFQNCTESVSAQVLAEVQRLKALYPTYSVKTTGHSLGAALA